MVRRHQSAVISVVVWSVILSIFVTLFFTLKGLDEWTQNQTFRLWSAILLLIGGMVQIYILSKGKTEPLDERTRYIQYKSNSASIIVVLLYVYALVMTLYTVYEYDSMVSVGWLWFIAYTSIMVTFIVNSALYLLFEYKGVGYED